MDDLWNIASGDHDAMAREASLARADAELEGVLPFLLAARSDEEYMHRTAMAMDSLAAAAARAGVPEEDFLELAHRRCALYREALMEGQDSTEALDPFLQGGQYGSGPEQADQHSEGPDFSHGYSEVPMGNLTGPDPRVTQPEAQAPPGPGFAPSTGMRRQADVNLYMALPPDTGTGSGSVDTGMPGDDNGGMTPSLPVGRTAASADPVRRKVTAVAALVARSNPGLARPECERIARIAVGRYIREADLADSVMSNGPMNGGGGSGGGGGHSGGGGISHMLEGQGIRSMLPGMGGDAAAGGEAAGAGELAELAPLLAL